MRPVQWISSRVCLQDYYTNRMVPLSMLYDKAKRSQMKEPVIWKWNFPQWMFGSIRVSVVRLLKN